ncbi:MAG: sugar ABC transporter ATP-binding protein [Mesorhizobium sp.]
MSGAPLISVRGLAKRYGGAVVLEEMNLAVARGAIHAVVGESGAGKSTLMKILAGIVKPDSGIITIDGRNVTIDSPISARKHGISAAFQETGLFPERSVLANLFVNRQPLRNGLIALSEMKGRSHNLLRQLGLDVDVRRPLLDLSAGERQLVGIARALLESPRLLILDEPNSALDQGEAERLVAVLRSLQARGMTMLYVSNRLEEVFAVADQITILRNGRDVLTKERSELTASEERMIGQLRQASLLPALPALPATAGAVRPRLTVSGLGAGILSGASFSARGGEIVGIAGLEGSGISDLLALLFGLRRPREGKANFPDGSGLPRSPTEAARRNIALISGDRRRNGLMLDKSLAFNMSSIVVGARNWGSFWYSPKAAIARAGRQIDALRIKVMPDMPAASLSAGEQQKLVLAKWLEIGPQVVLLDDPVRGIDVGGKQEIYALIRQIAASGCIVLFNSSELSELAGLSDRVLAFSKGEFAGEISGTDMDSQNISRLITIGKAPRAEQPWKTRQEGMA